MYGVAGDKATDLDRIGRFLFNFGNPTLSESYADILGYAFERYIYRTRPTLVGTANWDVGERVVPRRTKLRSMSNPLECQHPTTVGGQYWQVTSAVSDSGGVHINAGLPNYCFYLVATRTSPEYALRLWYAVLKHLITLIYNN